MQTSAAGADLLQILMFRKVLTREQAERVRRFARANSLSVIPTVVELKFASEVQIRDTETAENAVQAALTGHLVFSTLHTNDAPSAIPRLLDLGGRTFSCSRPSSALSRSGSCA